MKYKPKDRVSVITGRYKGFTGLVSTVNSAFTAPYPFGVKLDTKTGEDPVFLSFAEDELEPCSAEAEADNVNHPSHYKLAGGVEVIDLTELLNFNRGNAVKYVSRAGKKDSAAEIEDLKKARWYIDREINRLEKANG